MCTKRFRSALVGLGLVSCVPAALLGTEAEAPVVAPLEVRLAADGRALLPVVVGPEASGRVREAAAELADYLGRIAGATFVVAEGDGSEGIVVGVSSDFPALEHGVAFRSDDPFGREEYLLRTHEKGAWLLGAGDQAAVNAVWDVLHRLGYRLFFLTDTWEVVPTQADLRLAADTVAAPDYITRGAPRGAPRSNRELWRRWRERNRVNSEFVLRTGHAYDAIRRANPEAFRAHPEYYALVDGERRLAGRVDGGGIKFCISNPGLRELVVRHAVGHIRANPDLESISMDPSDGDHWCECEDCAALGSVTDQAIFLANEVATAINDLGLGPKYVGIYAYNMYSPPPAIDAHPKVVVSLATSFHRGGTTMEKMIAGWSERAELLGIREYHDVFAWSHDMPRRGRGGDLAYLARTIPHFHQQAARFMNSENSDSWAANGLGYWLSPIMLWDVTAAERLDEYVEDFLDKAFGAAREPMREFYRLLNRDRDPRTPEDVAGHMYRALAEARSLAVDPAVRGRLDDLILYTRYVELYNHYRGSSGAERQAGFERIWRHAYRMRDRMMLSTVAICNRDRFRDRSVSLPEGVTWATPEADHPWKSGVAFSAGEIEGILREGLAANPLQRLEFTPVVFSDELTPATALRMPDVPRGAFSLCGRGTRNFFIWLDEPGEIEIGVTGGLIAHYRDRGNVRLSLYSPLEATLEPVAHDASVPPDGERRSVTLRTPYAGLHRLEVSDGGDKTDLEIQEDTRVTIQSGWDVRPGRTLPGRWTLYFYVPRGTETVGGFAADRSGLLRDGNGKSILNFADCPHAGYFHVPVPEGQDGCFWRIENAVGEKLLMTVPPYLARSPGDLLLPREVVERDAAQQP
jgi:hypothetical protein